MTTLIMLFAATNTMFYVQDRESWLNAGAAVFCFGIAIIIELQKLGMLITNQ